MTRPDAFPRFGPPSMPVCAVQRCPTARQDAPQRIVIVKFGALGDILMATPLLSALRRAYPGAHLTWVVEDTNADAIDANPYIDEVLLWSSAYWRLMRSTKPRNWPRNWFGLRWPLKQLRLKRLLHRRFDTFISFHPEQWQFLLEAVAPKTSVGVFESPDQARRDYRECYTQFYTAVDFCVHQTDTYLLPLGALGLPPATDKQLVIGYTADDVELVDSFLREHGNGAGFIVLAPKTTWESKCWPEENWSALGDLLANAGQTVVLVGSAREGAALEAIAGGMQTKPLLLAGTLSFRQAAALLARASVCVSSDSGPMHLAGAVGTPCVSLFGPTSPARYAPLVGTVRALTHPVPCAPCMEQSCPNPPGTFMACLRRLPVAEVLNAVLEEVRRERPPSPQ